MPVDLQRVLATIGEPTRYRILEILATGPRTVGEVATALGALQPQTTKHLQALESAGVVRIHTLGRRRIARLEREALDRLAGHFGRLAEHDRDDDELNEYERGLATELARADGPADRRTLRFERSFDASAEAVWKAWTDPAVAARWLAPRHLTVGYFEFARAPGAPIRLVLREGDGTEYESRGRVMQSDPPRRLRFSLAPVDESAAPLFSAVHTVTIAGDQRTGLTLVIEVSAIRPEAAAAVAGLEQGWRQLLDALEATLQTR